MTNLSVGFSEVTLVLIDMYKPDSLKEKPRKRYHKENSCTEDDTDIKHIPHTVLSHEQTKADLTVYLAQVILNNVKHIHLGYSASGQNRCKL